MSDSSSKPEVHTEILSRLLVGLTETAEQITLSFLSDMPDEYCKETGPDKDFDQRALDYFQAEKESVLLVKVVEESDLPGKERIASLMRHGVTRTIVDGLSRPPIQNYHQV